MIYLDYCATTPVNSNVLNTFCEVTKRFIGNPNSLHKLGLEAKEIISASTKQIAGILGCKSSEVIYTSGASEANNTVIKGVCSRYSNRGNHIITTELEHSSILSPLSYLQTKGFVVDFVKLDENGQVDLDDLKRLMNDDTLLVTISSVNSEIGIRQPIKEISKIIKEYPKCFFHSDITQSVGKEKVDLSFLDFASFSAQKFFGIKGVGCLIKREEIVIDPLIHGGKSTTIYRSGTPATALIVSTARALREVYDNFSQKTEKVNMLNKYLIDKLGTLDIYINSNSYCVPHVVNISLNNIKAETMLHALEEEEIYVSTKTACSTSNISKAVYALTGDKDRALHSLRISISYLTTTEEIDEFIRVFKIKLKELGELNESN